MRQICLEVGLPDATRRDVQPEEVRKCLKLENLKQQKSEMVGMTKLQELSQSDTRFPQEYVSWTVDECRMAYRLQTKMFDCRANMPSRYKRDLLCRACQPDPASGREGQEETQDHLEVCRGYSELWQGLGPMTTRTRTRYFMRVKNKRSKAVK